VFEPWTRARQQSVFGGIAAILVIVAVVCWTSRETPGESAPLPPFDVAARRAGLAESTAREREGALARVSWGATAGATSVTLGDAAPVQIPVADGRALATIGIRADEDGKRPFVVLTVSVFAGERRLFGSTLNKRDAAGTTDALTISFNAEAVRAAGVGAEPLTVRVEGFDAGGRYPGREHDPGPGTFGEARLVIVEP
jgi:hypothetical protein